MKSSAALACVLWILSGAYVASFVTRGWIPHDEGTIAQSAERVLRGQLPHRDFDEVYTGGLTFLHAGAMKVFGVNLRTPRLVLFVFFMLFLAAFYALAREVTSPPVALAAMALAVVWSVPNYFVSLPSWYTLFFATFGILALTRYIERKRRLWLVVAGVFGGLSILVKITGVYYVAAAFLFFLYLEWQQWTANRHESPKRSWFWLIATLPGVCMLLLLAQEPTFSRIWSFAPLFVAPLMVCGFIAWQEWTAPVGEPRRRFAALLRLIWPFVAGMSIVVVPFVLLFWWAGALPDFLRGVWSQPQRHLTDASFAPPGLVTLGLAVPYVLLLIGRRQRSILPEPIMAVGLAIALGALLISAYQPMPYRAIWAIVRSLPLLASLTGIWLLTRKTSEIELTEARRAQIVLLTTMVSILSLVQFPYASPTYIFYTTPLIALALGAIVSARPEAPLRVHAVVAGFFFLFAVLFVNRSYGWNLGAQFIRYAPESLLEMDRGGLVVSEDDARTYDELVRILKERAAGGTIYAAPDCPEVFFLSGLSNPTSTILDFRSREREDAAWVDDLLNRAPVRVVVINTQPMVSPRLDQTVETLLEHRFPRAQRIGRFVVRTLD